MTCPLCGAAAPLAGRAWARPFHQCPQCDLAFVPRAYHLTHDEERARYTLHENTLENKGYVQMFTRKLRVLRRVWQDVETVLDYGCGPGPVLVELLRRMGYRAVGYDPYFAPNTDLSRQYDAVVSTETFEHFAAPRLELERIGGLVRPGGYVAVVTQLRTDAIPVSEWWYAREPTHIAFYSARTFAWIAGHFGWEEVYRDGKEMRVYRTAAPAGRNPVARVHHDEPGK